MSALNEFRLFSSLPTELRVKIWGIALSIPRNVNIICQPSDGFTNLFKSSDRPPALLHICHESRSEALEIYKPLFQTESSPIYVAYSQDIIIVSDNVLKYMRGVGIQKMTINIKHSWHFGHFGTTPLKKMQPSLRELELIFEEGPMYDRGDGHMLPVRDDIYREIITDPSWDCPNIKIVDGKTGKIV
jgi:hypothetical protein